MSAQLIRAKTKELFPESIAQLKKYVHLESPSQSTEYINIIAKEIAKDFTKLGATVTFDKQKTGNNIVIKFKSRNNKSGKKILILCHHDTVWPVGTIKKMPWVEDEATCAGPGTYDMKGGITVVWTALKTLKELDLAHPTIKIISTADEEVGSNNAKSLIKKESKNASFAFGMEPPHPDGALKSSRYGSSRIKISVTGVSAHAALNPDKGASAAEEIMLQLAKIRQYALSLSGTLYNLGSIKSTGQANVVNKKAQAIVGLRFTKSEQEEKFFKFIKRLEPENKKTRLKIKILSNRPAWNSDNNDKILYHIAGCAKQLQQKLPDAHATSGAGDTNITGSLGVVSVDGFGPLGEGAHAKNEKIVKTSISDKAALLALTLHKLDK